MAMGAADVVPGVSGGTVAFITGIYAELIRSISEIDSEAFRLLTRRQFRELWKKINGNFLIVLLSGLITSFVSLARLVAYLMTQQPILVGAFFFGIILISCLLVLREIKTINATTLIFFFASTALAFAFTFLSPIETPDALWLIFMAGVLAACAMMLPGISGVLILLLIGQFQYLLSAVSEYHFLVVAIFLCGSVVGLVGYCKAFNWFIERYRNISIALLAGFMLGSLNKVWPWREVLEYVTNREGVQVPVFDKSVVPWKYFEITGKDPQVLHAVLIMALAVLIVVIIEKIAVRLKTKI
jgi:putative membrane protein